MPESRFVSAKQIKPLLVYCASAFVVLLGLSAVLAPGSMRNGLVAAWIVCFPVGAWLVYRRA